MARCGPDATVGGGWPHWHGLERAWRCRSKHPRTRGRWRAVSADEKSFISAFTRAEVQKGTRLCQPGAWRIRIVGPVLEDRRPTKRIVLSGPVSRLPHTRQNETPAPCH